MNLRRGVVFVPSIITAFGLICGLFIIFRMSQCDWSTDIYAGLWPMCLLLLVAAFADSADGAVARRYEASSHFGMEFDSFSDAVTFGVAPAVMLIRSLPTSIAPVLSGLVLVAAMTFSLAGVLRLVRYNLMSLEHTDDEGKIVKAPFFTGLPIPFGCGCLTTLNLALVYIDHQGWVSVSVEERAYALVGGCLVLGYFMLSRWKFPHLTSWKWKFSNAASVFLIAIIAGLLCAAVWFFAPLAFFVVCWSFLLVSFALSLVRFFAGKGSKILAGFEREPSRGSWLNLGE